MKIMAVSIILTMLLVPIWGQAACQPGPIQEHVGKVIKKTEFKTPKQKCDQWVSLRFTVRDVMTNEEVNAYVTDSTQCYNRNGQSIDCKNISPIWPVILTREVRTTQSGLPKPFALVVQQIEGAH